MRLLLAALLAWPLPALAQGIDCAAPSTQAALTACAGQALDLADAELNDAYAAAIDLARIGLVTRFATQGDIPAIAPAPATWSR